ncbi:MAG: helix-turn-helix domain-containing protein [Burkholderiaceae bacterium]|nr:MAG: helix-turn-helix domain-containing protein [Burkholderiaceae bacterium]
MYGIYAVSRRGSSRHSDAVLQSPRSPSEKSPRRATSFDPLAARAFGAAIRALRERVGVAQDQLALMANIDRSYYGKLERGERQPSLGLLLRAAKALGVSGATLVLETERRLEAAGEPKQRAGRASSTKARP